MQFENEFSGNQIIVDIRFSILRFFYSQIFILRFFHSQIFHSQIFSFSDFHSQIFSFSDFHSQIFFIFRFLKYQQTLK